MLGVAAGEGDMVAEAVAALLGELAISESGGLRICRYCDGKRKYLGI